jgi:hypothetical protein
MSYLSEVKNALKITHNEDDKDLNRKIESAAYECITFLNISLESDQDALDIIDNLPPQVFTGLILIVQADYDGEPEKRDIYRNAALNLWQPYRLEIGP